MSINNLIYSHVLLEGMENDPRWDDIITYYDISNKGEDLRLPTSIQIWSGQFLDKIQVNYGSVSMEPHGFNEPGGNQIFTFAENEYIIKVTVDANPTSPNGTPIQIGRLIIATNLGNTHEFHSWSQYGGCQRFEYELPPNTALVAFGGRFGGGINIISGLTLHYKYINPGSDEPKCDTLTDEVRTAAFQCEYYKTLSETAPPTSNVWVNMIKTIDIPQDCDLLCASVSSGENEAAYPDGVYSAMLGPAGQLIPKETDQEHVHLTGEKFHQMFAVRPASGKYKILVRHRLDAQIFVEYQSILQNCENIPLVQSMPRNEEKCYPFYGRPLQRLLITHASADTAELNNEKGVRGTAILPYTIYAFASLHPFVTASFLIVCGVSILYAIYRSGKEPVDEVMQTLRDNAKWSATSREDRSIYKTLTSSNYASHARLSGEDEKEADRDALALYRRLLEKNGNDMRVSRMKRITRSDLQGKKLVVDIGGEGCTRGVGIRVAGVNRALNLNGLIRCYETGLSIPMLLHFSHWDSESFPFEDGIVDAFIMQATPSPTLKQANEIIRCLNKESGRFDLISNGWDNEELMCYQYIRNGLGFGLFEGEEMVRAEYPHLVGTRYLTLYSAAYTPSEI